MLCNEIKEKLMAYMDGLASAEEKAMIEEHLEACKECRESLSDLKKTISYVKTLEDLEPPAWLSQKIMTEIRGRDEKKEGILHKLFYPLHIKLPVQAIATILIAVTAFYIFKTIQPDVRISESPEEEISAPQTLGDKDSLTKSSERGKSREETKVPLITGDSPMQRKSVETPVISDGEIARSLTGEERRRLSLKEVTEDEERRPEPAEPMRQMYHAKDPELSDEYEKMPETGMQIETQQNMKKDTSATVESRTAGLSFEAGKTAGKNEQFIDVTLIVENLEDANKDIDKIVAHLEGQLSEIEKFEDGRILIIIYDISYTDELMAQLRLIGDIKKKEQFSGEHEGYRKIRIELVEEE